MAEKQAKKYATRDYFLNVSHDNDALEKLPMHSPPLAAHLSEVMRDFDPIVFVPPTNSPLSDKQKITITNVDIVSVITAIADSVAHTWHGLKFHQVSRSKHSPSPSPSSPSNNSNNNNNNRKSATPTKSSKSAAAGEVKTNEFGDEILSVDELAEDFLRARLAKVGAVISVATEDHPQLDIMRQESGCLCVCADSLDGSSVAETNGSVGTICAIFPGSTAVGCKVSDIVASVVAVYGPRCHLFVALRRANGQPIGVFEYMLFNAKTFGLLHKQAHQIAPRAKFFSPANLRAAAISSTYLNFVVEQIKSGTTLRYSGAMVPDCMQIMIKKSGIFATPAVKPFVVKLRMCYEVAPIAFMIECAGGESWSIEGGRMPHRLMNSKVTSLSQRSSIVCGSSETVRKLVNGFVESYNRSKL